MMPQKSVSHITIQHSNIHVIRSPEEKKTWSAEKILEEIMAENFTSLKKHIYICRFKISKPQTG